METTALRLYGKRDLRLEKFALPDIKDDEILVEVVTDSVCMSTYKAAILGSEHKRVPADISDKPIIVGHEMAGNIVAVGAKWRDKYKPGQKYAIQPALNYKGSMDSPGYSYRYCGGTATHAILPPEVMELDCLLPYSGESYYEASLAEPMSCIIGAFAANYHTRAGSYQHCMGIKPGGKLAIMAGAGPMGLGAVDYALHGDVRPRMAVVTDVDAGRLERAAAIFAAPAAKAGVELHFVNTGQLDDPVERLLALSGGGYDDVFVFAPVRMVVEQADRILGRDGCLNFFAGPTDTEFRAACNFYNVHYNAAHILGTTGGNTDDMREALRLTEKGRINPAVMVTHIGGLDSSAEAVLTLPDKPAGKKLIYTGLRMPLTAIEDFAEAGKKITICAELAKIVEKHNGLWNLEAERCLLAGAPRIGD